MKALETDERGRRKRNLEAVDARADPAAAGEVPGVGSRGRAEDPRAPAARRVSAAGPASSAAGPEQGAPAAPFPLPAGMALSYTPRHGGKQSASGKAGGEARRAPQGERRRRKPASKARPATAAREVAAAPTPRRRRREGGRGPPRRRRAAQGEAPARAPRRRSRARPSSQGAPRSRRRARGAQGRARPAVLNEEEQIRSAKYLPRDLPPRLFEEERFLFPESYGVNRIRLLVKDPEWLFAHWDVDPKALGDMKKAMGERGHGPLAADPARGRPRATAARATSCCRPGPAAGTSGPTRPGASYKARAGSDPALGRVPTAGREQRRGDAPRGPSASARGGASRSDRRADPAGRGDRAARRGAAIGGRGGRTLASRRRWTARRRRPREPAVDAPGPARRPGGGTGRRGGASDAFRPGGASDVHRR